MTEELKSELFKEELKQETEHRQHVKENKRKLEKKLVNILFNISQAPTSPAHAAQCKNAELLMRYLGISDNVQFNGSNS